MNFSYHMLYQNDTIIFIYFKYKLSCECVSWLYECNFIYYSWPMYYFVCGIIKYFGSGIGIGIGIGMIY